MFSLTKQFGGLNNRLEPHLLPPSQAQDLNDVILSAQSVQPALGLGASVATGAGTLNAIYKFNGNWILASDGRQFCEFGGYVMYAPSGSRPKKSQDGTNFYNLGIDAPATALTAASGAAGNLNGTYEYYVTFTTIFGSESAPSPVSGSVACTNTEVILTSIPLSPDPQVDGRNIYRAGGQMAATMLVGVISDNTTSTFTDNTPDTQAGATLTSTTYGTPTGPNYWSGIAAAPYGVIFGWYGRRLFFSQAGFIDAYPASNYFDFPDTIVNVIPYYGSIVVLTKSAPYTLLGTDASTFRVVNIMSQQGAKARDGVAQMNAGLFWVSQDGIAIYNGYNVELVSKQHLSDAFISTITGSAFLAMVRYNDKLYLFHSGGYIEYDTHIDPPWKKGDTVVGAVHYNHTDNVLYVAQGSNVYPWGQGAAQTMTYWTGDWSGDQVTQTKHFRRIALEHSGTLTVSAYVDGVQVPIGSNGALTITVTRATLGRSLLWLGMGGFGHRISVKVQGTGTLIEVLADFEPMSNL